ncbi:MAG: hypothetical protein ACXVJT_16180 [Thermoanaerobaculia bacterium]
MIGIAMWLLLAGSPDSSYATTVRPILERRCQPCHFPGGKMYERLPFDRPETIVKLGTKLFTRIKDEKERDVIRKFLSSTSRSHAAAAPLSD